MKSGADLEAVIDSSRIGSFQIVIVVLCSLVAMMDGFDTQSIAFAAPEIIRSWTVERHAFGVVFGSGLFGGLIGAIVFGIASDRVGRKRALVIATVLMSAGSLATLFAHSIDTLVVMRAITGFGLGGAVPSFIALVSEYMPKRVRSTAVGLMFCGFPLGAVLGGFGAAWLIPEFGWKSIFIAGGALPLLMLPIFLIMVPESARFLAAGGRRSEVEKILQKMNVAIAWNGKVEVSGETHTHVASLFTHRRAGGTLLLWAVFFLSLLMTYFLINWIPVVVRDAGISLRSAVVAVAVLNLGAVIGCIVIGWLSDRVGQTVVIGGSYLLGALAICLIGQIDHSAATLYVVTFFAGAFSIGAQMCTVALCADFYESFLRGTGIGWSIGVGRVGAIVGPVMGGALIKFGYGAQALFTLAGLASLVTAFLIFALERFVLTPRNGSVATADI